MIRSRHVLQHTSQSAASSNGPGQDAQCVAASHQMSPHAFWIMSDKNTLEFFNNEWNYERNTLLFIIPSNIHWRLRTNINDRYSNNWYLQGWSRCNTVLFWNYIILCYAMLPLRYVTSCHVMSCCVVVCYLMNHLCIIWSDDLEFEFIYCWFGYFCF